MKPIRSIEAILGGAALSLLLSACVQLTPVPSGVTDFEGTWTNADGSTVVVNADNTLEFVDTPNDYLQPPLIGHSNVDLTPVSVSGTWAVVSPPSSDLPEIAVELPMNDEFAGSGFSMFYQDGSTPNLFIALSRVDDKRFEFERKP